MTPCIRTQADRRKAVWGPKSTLAALMLVVLGLSPDAMAAGRRHDQQNKANTKHRDGEGKRAKPAAPNSQVKRYKADDEVSQRKNGNPLRTSRVIVTLVPGAQLPSEFKRFAKGRKLDIINGFVLDLPNGNR